MKVLFYLDPSVEFNNPNFRYTSYKNSLLPQIRALKDSGHEVSIVISSSLAENISRDSLMLKGVTYHIVDIFEVLKIGNFSEIEINGNAEKYKKIISLLRQSINEDNDPDLIVIWESHAKYLGEIYKSAKIIYQSPGFFSRPPFPQLISMNTGILSESESPDRYFLEENNFNLSEVRNVFYNFFSETSQLKDKIKYWRTKFAKIILFPLQIDGYFMIDSQMKGLKQIDILLKILETIPNNCALLITDYRSKDINSNVITKDNENLLKQKYKNLIYDESINKEFCASQQLLPFVDAVITISSSVGLQAAFWELPLYVYGNNFVSYFQNATSIAELVQKAGQKFNQDSRINKALIFQNILTPDKYDSSQEWTEAFFNFILQKKIDKNNVHKALFENLRKKEYLRAIRFDSAKLMNRTNCPELIAQIKKHRIISFDIFDTLLVRPFLSPSDLFKYIEPKVREIINDQSFDFVGKRRIAEKIAFENALQRNEGETTIDEIYSVFIEKNELPENCLNVLRDLEIATEREVLYRRESIYNAYLTAQALNKEIIIISDMYLPKKTLEDILSKNGIEYSKIYLSSDLKKKKSTGELFDIVIEDQKCKPEEILHIGDNVKGDLKVPKAKGIHCFHMPRTIEKMLSDAYSFYNHIWKRDEKNHSLSARSILAILGNYYYDNSYLPLRKNTLFNGDLENLGFMGFGPLLFGYVKWLCEESIRNSVGHLYFLARDGKVMKEAYDIVSQNYKNAPISHYMLCSRRSVNLCKITDFSGINDLLHVDFASNTRLDCLIQDRFGINPNIIDDNAFSIHNFKRDQRVSNSDIEQLIPFFKEIKNLILQEAHEERTAYINYLDDIGYKPDSTKIGLVDIGYAGTMQQSLKEIRPEVETSGFYLITFRKALERLRNNKINSYGYLGNFIDRHDTSEPFCRFVPLFETLFSSSDTSFIKFVTINNKRIPIFQSQSEFEKKRVEVVNKIHSGAMKFITTTCNVFKDNLQQIDVEPYKSERMLINYFTSPDPRDAKLLQGIIFEDAYGGKPIKILLPEKLDFTGTVVWRAGLEALKKQITPSATEETNRVKVQLNEKKGLKRIIYMLYGKILSEKLFSKFENRPEEFFNDSQNIITRKIVSKLYLS